MNTKLLSLITTALVAGGITLGTLAADSSSNPPTTTAGQPGGKILQRIAERLDLTADQKAQIQSVLADDKDTLQSLLGQLHTARINLRAAIRASDASESAVRTASAKVAGVEADLAVERMKLYGKIAPILTDEQRQKLSTMEQHMDEFVDNVIARIGSGLAD